MEQQIGERRFFKIPGNNKFELPPFFMEKELILQSNILELAEKIVESDMIDVSEYFTKEGLVENARINLALNFADQYYKFCATWHFGNAILDWIRHCQSTFKYNHILCHLLGPDLWPHVGQKSFVNLLADKSVCSLKCAKTSLGLRLMIRKRLPLDCCTDDLLFYLGQKVTETAYNEWAGKLSEPVKSLPPERFYFEVLSI